MIFLDPRRDFVIDFHESVYTPYLIENENMNLLWRTGYIEGPGSVGYFFRVKVLGTITVNSTLLKILEYYSLAHPGNKVTGSYACPVLRLPV